MTHTSPPGHTASLPHSSFFLLSSSILFTEIGNKDRIIFLKYFFNSFTPFSFLSSLSLFVFPNFFVFERQRALCPFPPKLYQTRGVSLPYFDFFSVLFISGTQIVFKVQAKVDRCCNSCRRNTFTCHVTKAWRRGNICSTSRPHKVQLSEGW